MWVWKEVERWRKWLIGIGAAVEEKEGENRKI
jgi:hypothetical protein